jgi:hypothetical protein
MLGYSARSTAKTRRRDSLVPPALETFTGITFRTATLRETHSGGPFLALPLTVFCSHPEVLYDYGYLVL